MIVRPAWLDLLLRAMEANGDQPASRHVQLATVRRDVRPANRTVVVRRIVEPDGAVWITTDARSAKLDDLAHTPWAEVCVYLVGTREQFRLLGRVEAVGPATPGADRAEAWRLLSDASRATFFAPAPGTPFSAAEASATPPTLDAPPPTFVLLVLHPESVEYLDLRPAPHHRERWTAGGPGWEGMRLNP